MAVLSAGIVRIRMKYAGPFKRFCSGLSNSVGGPGNKHDSFGFLFDIDGVFVRGKEVFPEATEALHLLRDTSTGGFKIPCVFVTNAGNTLRQTKSEQLSERLGVKITADQMILSHSPLKMFRQFHDKRVLVSGQGPVRDIAKNIGFRKVVTVDALRHSYPLLDMVDHTRRRAEPGEFEEFCPEIEAIVLFGEPVRWETNLQLIMDLLLTNGKPDSAPLAIPDPHIPVLACNMDMTWMSEACMPRFGHGCFLYCLECLYKKFTGKDLKYTALIGKPSPITYHHAEYMLNEHAKTIGIHRSIKRLYCIGDNPDTDIYGANLYNRYLQNKKKSTAQTITRRSRLILGGHASHYIASPTGCGAAAAAHVASRHGSTSAAGLSAAAAASEFADAAAGGHHLGAAGGGHQLPHQAMVSDWEVCEEELLDSAETCESILVATGVYSKERQHQCGHSTAPPHVDFAVEEDLRIPKRACANILEAVRTVLELERHPAAAATAATS